jgi:hypothetical protein
MHLRHGELIRGKKYLFPVIGAHMGQNLEGSAQISIQVLGC